MFILLCRVHPDIGILGLIWQLHNVSRDPGLFCLSAHTSSVHSSHFQGNLMVQNGWWSSCYHIYIPDRRTKELWMGKMGSLSELVYLRSLLRNPPTTASLAEVLIWQYLTIGDVGKCSLLAGHVAPPNKIRILWLDEGRRDKILVKIFRLNKKI